MWRELMEAVCAECNFQPPASDDSLAEAERALGVALPSDLRSLYLETNGVTDKYGDGIWPVEQVVKDNLELRRLFANSDLYMSFDALLFFGDAGNGDQFFFPIQTDGNINRRDVFVWDHETDSREWVAGDLRRFVEQWFSGKLQR